MSRVRYVNKKTGWVSIYESTSCYNPVKKTSRPKRTYIGYEDPVTKEFVPSSGKPGRKKRVQQNGPSPSSPQQAPLDRSGQEHKQILAELEKQRAENNSLREQLQLLKKQLEGINDTVDSFIRSIQSVRQ